MRPSAWLRGAVGAGVLVPALLVALAPSGDPPVASGAAMLPDPLAAYSHLTGAVSSAPPGRAIALFQHGFGVEFLDFPQAVVIGADGNSTRRLDVAENRVGGVAQGDPAPMLLSPDGTRVAVGVHVAAEPDLLVVDLADGRVERHPMPGGRSTLPIAWSSDARRLAYLSSPEATDPHSGFSIAGDAGVLDLGTGRAAPLPGASEVVTAAFSPDGDRLAVQHSNGVLTVRPLDGGAGRTVAPPAGYRLDGPDAWSPDGALLATWSSQGGIAFIDATGAPGATPRPLDRAVVGPGHVLGWSAPDRVTVLVPDTTDGDPDRHLLLDVPLDGTDPRQLSVVPTSGGRYGVSRFQVAAGLLSDLEVREAGDVDRGRWPLWLRLGTALAVGVAAVGAAGPGVRVLGRAGGRVR